MTQKQYMPSYRTSIHLSNKDYQQLEELKERLHEVHNSTVIKRAVYMINNLLRECDK